MPKKKIKDMSFSEILQKKLEKHNRRQQKNMELFRAEQRRQGKKSGEAIDLMTMVENMKKGKK